MILTDMQIYVPSRSRWVRSLTLEAVASRWDHVALVVPVAQMPKYKALARKHKVPLLGCPLGGIAGTRMWIGEQARDKFLMLDDDLRFYERTRDSVALHKPGKNTISNMLVTVSRYLDEFKHVAISARGGNNQLPYPVAFCKRPLRALAYRKKEFLACTHGRVQIMEDFDVTLQLLRMGYQNAVITQYAQDQPVTQMPGGCSDYRTHELHAKNVKRMAELHPGLVKLRMKENKTGGEFGKRLEATIYWQKAHQQAMEEVI